MQKLVKKTRHYQTMVPVEAYHGEEEGYFLQDEINVFLWGLGTASIFASSPFGAIGGVIVAVGTAANTDTGREVIDTSIETYGERQMEVGFAELEGNQELVNTIGDAIADGIDAVSDALDNGDSVAPPPVVPDGAITGRHLH